MKVSRRTLVCRSFLAAPLLRSLHSFAQPAAIPQAPTGSPAQQWYWYPGHDLTFLSIGKETGGTTTWMLVENSPREGVPFHKHLHEDESFFVVDGIFEITVGERTISGGPGTYIYGPRNVPHRWTNMGTGRGRMLNVYTPSGFENYFLAAAIPISRPGEMPPIDLTGFQARTAPLREKFGLIRTGPLKYPFS